MPHLVVAGALVDGTRVLLGHRRATRRYYPDRWDLLGGHIEPDETPHAALVRELREEAGVQASVVGEPSLHVEDQPEREDGLVLDIWIVTSWRGHPRNVAEDEHDALQWFAVDDLPQLRLAHPVYPAFLTTLLSAQLRH